MTTQAQTEFREFGCNAMFIHRRYFFESGSAIEASYHMVEGETIRLHEEEPEFCCLTVYKFEGGVLKATVDSNFFCQAKNDWTYKHWEAVAIGTEDRKPLWSVVRLQEGP